MKKHKLILPASILLGCIILGGFIYASQINRKTLGGQTKINQGVQKEETSCELPPIWGEMGGLYKSCHLTQVEQAIGLSDTFTPSGANGVFNYCNSLTWRKYTTDAGIVYTYEKIRYKHFPNSEVGEYRAPEILYNEMTNNRPCTPSSIDNGFGNDDDISADAFPSSNNTLETYKPKNWASFFNRHYPLFHWKNNN